jgi:hypothetical protein
MANVIIKSEERRRDEERVRQSFGAGNDKASREAVEIITARSREAYEELKRMEEKNK